MLTEQNDAQALLVLPRLRVQNANAISSPMTWGFPAITAFTGFMTALERKLGRAAGLSFHGVGVICHGFEPQVANSGYTRSFNLTRNPVLQDGSTAAIVEEGRVHLDVTLVFDVRLDSALIAENERRRLAAEIHAQVAGMRLAGGSVMPPLAGAFQRTPRAQLVTQHPPHLRRLSRRWLPGFALVSRDDLLQTRLAELQTQQPEATVLDAWLDLSRLNYRASPTTSAEADQVTWAIDKREGWLVPIPVGFAALSALHPSGTVAGVRDASVPFQFVECVYSIGQWISPHRIQDIDRLMWRTRFDDTTGLYRCVNAYQPPSTPAAYNPETDLDSYID
ncbi:type I-F CRISPR-associated protein Csy2 [Leptothrix ochracea]|uniref:type I-F CRISPR-associated protein Csy2 n=1 Tax=Leptothrix ochracea TaxID=735331 RepID=UPI0034E21E58